MKLRVCLVFSLWTLFKVAGKPSITLSQSQFEYDVIVDATTSTGVLEKMWDNTGLSPPKPGKGSVDYLTSRALYLNLALFGSLPFKAITHVRIHWLLDLIKVNSTGDGKEIKFDYKLLDDLIAWLRVFRMRPGFELMGNPGSLFDDLDSNPEKLALWQSFVADLASHYIDKFGVKEVERWRFELWNEPDSKQYNILNLTTLGYLKYAYASMKGLALWGLRVSGPAGTFRDLQHHNLSWGILRMCNSMIAQTGRCGLETITFHKKGEGDAENVVSSSSAFYSLVSTLYPLLGTSMQFANNEADILSGWWREEAWRGDVSYAADVCQVLSSFLSEIQKKKIPLSYISNDNGFLNQPPAYFDQRTLTVRFQKNNSQDLVSQFVRKPVMVAMALLSYLGPKKLKVIQRPEVELPESDARMSVLAASEGSALSEGWSAAVVLAISASTLHLSCADKTVRLTLKLPPDTEVKIVVYQLDNVLTNPRNIWVQNGKPDFPDDKLLNEMRDNEGPHIYEIGSSTREWKELTLKSRCPSVTLVHLCRKPPRPPAKVLSLLALNITFNEVLLFWQDSNTRCVKTYEVYFCQGKCLSKEYSLITKGNLIMLSYQFKSTNASSSSSEATRGKYKVRVLDYWNSSSAFSEVLLYP